MRITKEELTKFIDTIDTLNQFEGQQRMIRGYGAFDEKDLPIPEYIKVREWLVGIRDKDFEPLKPLPLDPEILAQLPDDE